MEENLKEEAIQRVRSACDASLDNLLRAFIEETGANPSECELVFKYGPDGFQVYARKRQDMDPLTRYEDSLLDQYKRDPGPVRDLSNPEDLKKFKYSIKR